MMKLGIWVYVVLWHIYMGRKFAEYFAATGVFKIALLIPLIECNKFDIENPPSHSTQGLIIKFKKIN